MNLEIIYLHYSFLATGSSLFLAFLIHTQTKYEVMIGNVYPFPWFTMHSSQVFLFGPFYPTLNTKHTMQLRVGEVKHLISVKLFVKKPFQLLEQGCRQMYFTVFLMGYFSEKHNTIYMVFQLLIHNRRMEDINRHKGQSWDSEFLILAIVHFVSVLRSEPFCILCVYENINVCLRFLKDF